MFASTWLFSSITIIFTSTSSLGAFVLLSISTFIFMGHTEGCFFLLLGAIINLIGVSKKKHYPEGFQSGVLGNPNVHSVSSINTKFAKEEFSTEAQYKDCRSPHAYVPHEGEDVFYFPQGHLEQIEASMSHGLNQQLPAFFLPTKILCKVVNDQLWVEEDSEQVYAQITLLPHQDQSEVAIHNHPMPEPRCCNVCSFYETPTACDTSAPGGLRKHTHLSVLATAHHAVTAMTLFTVIYKPRATQSAFIISVNRYLNAQNPKPCVGMKFTMGFENEMVLEERFGGTIVAVGDEASSKWPESEWKSLKVQWDEPSPILPDRISLWEIKVRPSRTIKWTCCCLQGLKGMFGGGEEGSSLVFLPAESLCSAQGYVLPCL